ncbi:MULTISPECIES: TetR/AcrR family transcriptional regulator [Agrobacterium]|jgi:AcrR family transcriptional regulator|uniref:TetR/AcrR family transcriptional regulator n=1 Tax=Agrobacterium tumefaciens TaxID=358 RepID=UPI0009BB7DEE|nr:TetR/AcrR family transcriptional regulator [Agrobacterium tumefaciens]AYM14280.1 TetR family transcriptional regulator [Agrobacterium tumefaciens]NSY10217.1 TetR/AcrR family transcriptional regulator [Agrobacterium tumefaciens]NSY93859.1 TetR/AcrR family transcriptional regulator [Agrobacterium tumefaciens]NSZ09355.1 TetR/AcrR family transcriptional regulator [Agrobacterium tumefaciens]CUX05452.1 TetR family transcriptional regulator [Agrobacterium fabacearum S56]
MARMVAERSDAVASLAEVFREHGYEGASLALIGKATGLGKGSLYHFFPNGKEEMVQAVLVEIEQWFENSVYSPLRDGDDADAAITAMLDETAKYFRSGRRVCLVGALAVTNTRDLFAQAIRGYFVAWVDALQAALVRQGRDAERARILSEDAVLSIQGAIVLSRALDDPAVFQRAIDQLHARLATDGKTLDDNASDSGSL